MKNKKRLLTCINTGILFLIIIIIAVIGQCQGEFTKGESIIIDLIIISISWIGSRLSLIEDTIDEIEKGINFLKIIKR